MAILGVKPEHNSPSFCASASATIVGSPVENEKQVDASAGSEKRFLIFDQSGDQMRLFVSPSLNLGDKSSEPTAVAGVKFSYEDVSAAEKWDENHLTDDEGSETGEDSEEIDALLDSDVDYKTEEKCSDEDEVTSTRHKDDELTSSDGSRKRRRLLGGDADRHIRIRRVLKIMESILPRVHHNKDPLSIIDAAIVYLKSMKAEAKDIGLIPTTTTTTTTES